MIDLNEWAYRCASNILSITNKAKCGHIGSSLSCVSVLVDIFFNRKNKDDVFILSKGHAASALYSILNLKGLITDDQLSSFYQESTFLSAHPPCNGPFNDIRFGTGSLGHGLSLAVGIALAKKLLRRTEKVFCLLSDGDCQEGSTWEALMFAGARKLDNLFVYMDNNSIQGFGRTKDILPLDNLSEHLKLLGFDSVICSDGNNLKCLDTAFNKLQNDFLGPKCIIAKTVKGYGVSFMEDTVDWHYLPMNNEQYLTALNDIKKLREAK
ncbi:MAG: transketolase [Bacteriovoracaceae bacterium]|nr:transketolase [Bacteriovoracaceae bacterium]